MNTCQFCSKGLECDTHKFYRNRSFNENGPDVTRSRTDLRIHNPNPVELEAPEVDINKG